MLAQRVVTAVVGIPILLGALYLGGTAWRLLVALIVVLGLWEFASLGAAGLYLDFLALSGLSFLAVTYSGVDGTKLLLWFALQLIYYLLRASFGGMRNFAAAASLLGVFYVAGLYSFFVLVREQFGLTWALFGILVTWATDSGAYFGGLKFGRHKLCPQISPKKSVEGAAFGLLGGALAGLILAAVFNEPARQMTAFALVLSACGQLGDLAESALKREKTVKDSGSILPGHGGILDRFDSLSFVFPVLYAMLTFLS